MSFTEEQQEIFDDYLIELMREKRFHETSDREIARYLLSLKDDKGNQVFTNSVTGKPYVERTIRVHIENFLAYWQRGASGTLLRKVALEQLYEASEGAADNPAMMKVVLDKVLPTEQKVSVDVKGDMGLSPQFVVVCDRIAMASPYTAGENGGGQGCLDEGHESALPGGTGESGQPAPKALPSPDDRAVHVLSNDAQVAGGIVPDTEGPPEDHDNNSGGDNLADNPQSECEDTP
jgi:hypothetical protein